MDGSSKKRKASGTSAKRKVSSKIASVTAIAKDDDSDWTDSELEREPETHRSTVDASSKKPKASRSSAKRKVIPKVASDKARAIAVDEDVTGDLIDTDSVPAKMPPKANQRPDKAKWITAVAELRSGANAESLIDRTTLQDVFILFAEKTHHTDRAHQPVLYQCIKEGVADYCRFSKIPAALYAHVETTIFGALKEKSPNCKFFVCYPDKKCLELPHNLVILKLRLLLENEWCVLPSKQREALKALKATDKQSFRAIANDYRYAKAGAKELDEFIAAAPKIHSSKMNFDECYLFHYTGNPWGNEEDAVGPLRLYVQENAEECNKAIDGHAFLDQALLDLKKDGTRTRFYILSTDSETPAKDRFYVELSSEHIKMKLALKFHRFISDNGINSRGCIAGQEVNTNNPIAQTISQVQTTAEAVAVPVAAEPKRKLCRFEGCNRQVIAQGLCLRHGAGIKHCKVPGCASQAGENSNDMCEHHFKTLFQGRALAKDDVTKEEWAAWCNESSPTSTATGQRGGSNTTAHGLGIASSTASPPSGTSPTSTATGQRGGSNTTAHGLAPNSGTYATGMDVSAFSTRNRLNEMSNTPLRKRVEASNVVGIPTKKQRSSGSMSTPELKRWPVVEVKTPNPPEFPVLGPSDDLYQIKKNESDMSAAAV